MFTCRPGQTVYFDLDDTLLEWQTCNKHEENAVQVRNNGHIFYKKAILPNIEALKSHSYAGHIVIVWSQGGVEWATAAIQALKLEDFVDVILTKPDWYYDDKTVEHWMPECQFRK